MSPIVEIPKILFYDRFVGYNTKVVALRRQERGYFCWLN